MVGATLGAGVGRYQGLHGLIIDALNSVEMVTSTGELITASKSQEPELFWGLRGAGFNYGIITEATYTVHNLTNNGSVLNADFKFPPTANGTYFEIMESFNYNLPAPLSLFTTVSVDADFGVSFVQIPFFPYSVKKAADHQKSRRLL
jgi:FAD/FMN-containing dehydrogenase